MSDVILRLALPSPLRRLFDYKAPASMARQTLTPGMRIRVPFGRREMIGVLVEVCEQSEVPADKLKPASALLDPVSPIPPSLFKLCLWTAQYYQHSLGDTLSWALPTLLRQGEPAEARQALQALGTVQLCWVPRRCNSEADALARAAAEALGV